MKKKLILLFILTVFFPIILSTVIISNYVEIQLENQIQNRAENKLFVTSNLYQEFIENLSLKTKIISQLEKVQNSLINSKPNDILEEIENIKEELKISYYDGTIEIFNAKNELFLANPLSKKIIAKQNYNFNALKTGEIKVYRHFKDEKLIVTSTYPVLNSNSEKPIGVISISYNISDKFSDELKKITDTEIVFFTVNKKNNLKILSSTLITENGRNHTIFSDNNLLDINFDKIKINQDIFISRVKNIKTPENNTYLAVLLKKNDLIIILSSVKRSLYIIGIFAVIFALITALFFSYGYVKELNKLIKNVELVGSGKFDKEIKIKTGDEFESLANTINIMRTKINDSLEEIKLANKSLDKRVLQLSIINEINQKIIKHKGELLLSEILRTIVKNMKVERSSLMLVEEQTKALMLKTVVTRDDFQIMKQYISLKVGEGIAGTVALTGESIYSNNPRLDSRFKNYKLNNMKEDIKNLACVSLKGDNSEILGIINIVNKKEDFTENDMNLLKDIARQVAIGLQSAELYEMSITDGMTNLFIHRYFQARLNTELKRAARYSEKLSLIMFDIDHFKKFNDTYGHPVGDIVIKKVADALKMTIREGIDIPSRYGGEEFAVIMPQTDIDGAFFLAERIRKNVEELEIMNEGKVLKVTISLGCAEFPLNAETKEDLINKADTALYKSKENGRNISSRST